MKIGKHLPLFFLSILFALILPHFYNHAFADATVTEFSIPTSNSGPWGITLGPNGNLWFTEHGGNKIGQITPGGTVTEFSIPTSNSYPDTGITSGPDGNLWFTEELGNKIGRITPNGTITEFSIPTSSSSPWGITSGPDGNLWFCEYDGNKIGQITPNGTITEFSIPTSSSLPKIITAGPDGNLWFTESNGNKVGRITPSGSITEFSIPNNGIPQDITSGPDGNLWVPITYLNETPTGKIERITTSGTITEYQANYNPGSITTASNGNLWFIEEGNRIGKITTSGTIIDYNLSTVTSSPTGITAGPDGNLWITENSGNKIGRINLSSVSQARPPLIFIPGIEGSNFTVDQTFDPGFGSCTYSGTTYSYNQGDIVWFDISRFFTDYVPCNSKYLDVLKLQSDGQTAVYPHVVVKNGSMVDAQGLFNSNIGYHDTLQYLEGRYTLNTNLFIFTYDWRKDLAGNMSTLNDLIDTATRSAGTTQVNLMAHSMGGLVARKYISDATKAQKVNTLVELGTPHAGSVDALANLLYRICIKVVGLCSIDGNEINTLVQNFTASFELLPSRLYYTLYPNLYPYNDTMFYGNMLGPLSYDSLHTLLDSYFHKNMTAFNTADSFHSNLDSTYSTSNGVKIYLIAGSGLKTLGQLFDYVSPVFGEIKTDAITTNGDAVVPLLSATLNNTSNVFYAKKNHGDLVASGSALYTAYNLLNGQTGLISGIQTTPFQGGDGQIVGVYSPTQLDAYDSSNNHTGKKSDGTYEQNIPGSEYYELGDSKFVYLPAGGSYNITTKATAAGHFDLKVKNYTNDQLTQQTLFFGVSQTASTTASMNLATTSAVLSVDVNGDGTNIQQVSPTYNLTGNSATDSAAPVTRATLSPTPNADGTYSNPVTVTLSASASAGFSVTNTYYKVDNGTQQTYTSSFTVSGAGSHTITYWSVDSAGLTEYHNSKTFTIAGTVPNISLRASASGNNGSGSSSLVISKPTGTANGDVMIAHVVVRTAGNTITAPTGWKLILRQDSGSSISTATYWKLAGSSEPTNYTWTFGTSGEASGGIGSYTGVNTTSPIDASNAQYNVSTSTVSNAGVTTTVANDMLVYAVGITVATTVNVPSGFTQAWSVTSSSSTTSEMSNMLDTTTGATGTVSGSHNGGASSNITHLIALKPATGPSNLAYNKQAFSSANESTSLTPDQAVDGDMSTRWSSAYSDSQWMYVDLGASYNINRVKLTWETAYGKAYQIQVSNDAANWTTIYSTTTGDGGVDDLAGLSGTGRYVRMYGTQRGTQWGYSLYEFEVYGQTTALPNISLRAASSGNNGSGGSTLAVNKPTGTINGDVMVAHVIVRTAGNTITPPTGWNLILRQDSGSSISTATYWKLAGSSEPTNYTWTFGTSGEASGGIGSYTGVNTTSPIDASNAQYNASTSTVSNSGVTTTVANDMLVFAVGITVPTTVNVPTGFTQEWTVTSSSSTTSEMSDKLYTSTGATGTISGSHNGGSNSNITHLIALKPASAPNNLALNKTAVSSSNESSSYTPDKAVDGDMSTRWSSAYSDPQWMYVDLGASYNINRVKLTWEAAYGKSYQIQTSTDATNWTTIYSTTTGDGGVDDLTGLSGTGRYVRMYGTQRGTQWGYSLYEFEIYGN